MPITDRQDAYGHLIADYHAGDNVEEIVERDDGFIDTGNVACYFQPFRRWDAPERAAMRLARGNVLDVGAGAGRVSLYLQDRGHDVVAVDNSPRALKVCRARGVERTLETPLTRLPGGATGFDTVVMYGNNWGLMGSPARARWLLGRLAARTNPGARILATTFDPRDDAPAHHRAYHRRNRARGRAPGQIRLRIRHLGYATPWFDYLFSSRAEVAEIVEPTRWTVERVVDDASVRIYTVVLVRDR